ncbi:MAG: helix-turn-helix domain-containing protein [Sanguibacteroides justesenii]|nr:helix-turn-helix domain-containing protein [Sanguibacteroides justesenii]
MGYTQKEISISLGKDKSIISRELKRNSIKRGVYLARSLEWWGRKAFPW